MKKVLLIAHDFPPLISIGAQRPYSWLKYLPEYGYQVTVVTRQWKDIDGDGKDIIVQEPGPGKKIVRVKLLPLINERMLQKYGNSRYVLIRRFLSFFLTIGRYFYKGFDSNYKMFTVADDLAGREKFDVIIATGEPFILFKYAAQLSKKYNIPWVADYRDCWSNTVTLDKAGLGKKLLFTGIYRNIERMLVKTVTLITTAAPTYKARLQQLHKYPVEVVYNGYDIDHVEELRSSPPDSSVFTIAYSGRFYARQRLETFLEGLKLFIDAYPEAKIKAVFYGLNFYPDMKNRLYNYNPALKPYIVTTDKISYAEVTRQMANAHSFLLLSDEGFDLLNAKVFDYIALCRPVILCKNDKGILESILDKTSVGYKASTAADVQNIIAQLYNDFNTGNYKLPEFKGGDTYSRRAQAGNLAALLNKYIGHGSK